MSEVAQRRKTIKARQRVCTKMKHESEEEARLHIKKLRAANPVATKNLEWFWCKTCSRKGKEVYHVGHRRKDYR